MLAAMLLLFAGVYAQGTIRGTVKDEGGTPLQGASVRAGKTVVVTDANGVFTIAVARDTKIDITYSGMTPLTVSAADGMVITLIRNIKQVEDVVVTGYSTRSRRSSIGSASTISIDDIRTQPNASFDQMLQGQAPGLNVKTGSGQPGRSADVIIRGKGSVNGSTAPLYIVDGVEVRAGDFSSINQNDFESITVLKDAATTALYGSRGANGVIVVTTRKGKAGRLRLAYDVQLGTASLPKNQLELMNTQEKLDFEINMAGNPWGWTPAEVTAFRKVNVNWNDYVFRKAKMQSHQLSASGGTDKTTFYSSFSYYKEDGVTLNTGIEKYNGRLNIAHTENKVKIGVNLSGGWSNFVGTPEGNQSVGSPLNTVIWALPYETPYDADGKYTNSVQFPFWLNPIEDLTENRNSSWQLKGTGNVYLEYKLPFIKNLTYRLNAGGDYSQFEGFRIIKNGTQSANQNTAFGQTFRGSGEVTRSLSRRFKMTVTHSLTHRITFGKSNEHNLTSSLFTEFIKNDGRSFNYTGYGVLLPFGSEAGLVAGTAANGFIPVVGGGFPENSTLLSYFASADYSYKNRYYLTLAGRSDGASKLSPKNRWTQYGSVGAAWLVSDESFFNVRAINYLKLRASFGSVGNQNGIGDFPSQQQFGRGTYGGGGTLQTNSLGNNDLTWEKRQTSNLGLDVELLKGRIRTTIEVYKSLTKGLYFNPYVPATSGGGGVVLSNAGSMENKGVELTVGVKIIDTRDFKWRIDANYAYNKNTIKSLPNGQERQLYNSFQVLQVGKPYNSFYLVKYAGVNPANGNSQYYKADGSITETYSTNDLAVLGTSDAPSNAGLTTTFNYKGIELSAFGVLSTGNYIYNNARLNVENSGYTTSGFAKNALTAWTAPGQTTRFPRLDEFTQSQTTRFLEKGDFFRLRNVILSYNLPKSLLDKMKIQGLRIFVQGQNLYTKFDFQGWDPEVSTINDADPNSNASVSGAQYPTLKRVTFGASITF